MTGLPVHTHYSVGQVSQLLSGRKGVCVCVCACDDWFSCPHTIFCWPGVAAVVRQRGVCVRVMTG